MHDNYCNELDEPLIQHEDKDKNAIQRTEYGNDYIKYNDNTQTTSQSQPSFPYNKKAVIFIMITVGLFTFNKISILSPLPQGQCYSDTLFNITAFLNNFFAVNVVYKNILLVTTALFTDILAIATMSVWCFKSKDPVFIVAGFLFYLLRFFIQQVFIFSFPTNYLFTDPGMKSFFVSYLKTNDFFYSGHAGFPVIAYFEYSRYKGSFIPPFALITLLMQIFLMLTLQGHYTIDLIIGSFTGYYIFEKIYKLHLLLKKKNVY